MKPVQDNPRKRVDITVKKGTEELFPDTLYKTLATSGIWLEEKGDDTIVRCYPENVDIFLSALEKTGLDIENTTVVDEPLQDYAALTKKYFRPIEVAGIVILAPWNKTRRKGLRLVIDPGMAFGTGRHESTRIMLKLMGTLDVADKDVIDIGCGSAILSLYASKLGARHVFAVDNDEDTILSAFKNVDLNDVQNVNLVCSDLQNVGGTYDIVLANIDIRTFRSTSTRIAHLVNDGGILVVSGILGGDQKEVSSLFANEGFNLQMTERMNAWRGFVFQKS